jgi:hypothetical protein
MAGPNDIRAGKAFVEIYADKTQLLRGLKSISADLKAFGAGVSSLGRKFMLLGAGVVAPMLAAAKTFATVGSGLNDMAARTGMGTNALSELGFAAQQTGASLGDVEIGVKRMQKAITAAKDGPLAGLKGMAPEQQFMAIAESLSAIQDPTSRAAKALEIFGRSGTSLIPMMGDVKALRAEAVRLGLSMGPEQAAAADALGDAWDSARASFKAVAVAIGSALAPMLMRLADSVKRGIASVRDWVAKHRAWIVTLFAAGVAAIATGAALFVLGKAIWLVGFAIAGALAIVKLSVAAFGLLMAVVGVLANPIAIVSVAIVALGVALAALGGYVLYASGALGFIGEALSPLLSDVKETFGVIAESMAAGDLVSAAKVGWALIELEWQKGISNITEMWGKFKGVWDESIIGFALAFNTLSARLQTIWAELMGFMGKAWNTLLSSIVQNKVFATIMSKALSVVGSQVSPESLQALGGIVGNQGVKIDAATAARTKQIEAERIGAADILANDMNKRRKARDAEIKAAQDKADAARKDWEKSKEDAQKAAKAEKEGKAGAPGMPELDLLAETASKTRGTFSGAAIAGLGVGGGMVKKLVDINARLLKIDEQMLQEQKRLTLEMVA